MKNQKRKVDSSKRRLPNTRMGDRLSATNMNIIHRAVNDINGVGWSVERQETRRCRFKITAKDNATGVLSGSMLFNSSKSGFAWTAFTPPKILTNLVDDDDAVNVDDEVWAGYCPQDGQWHCETGGAGTGTITDDDGDYNCCQCSNSKLYLFAENSPDITVEKVTDPKSLVQGAQIYHKIKVTCVATGESEIFDLQPLACELKECKTLDKTGQFIQPSGTCEIGQIFYGNDLTCINPTCPEGRPSSYVDPFDSYNLRWGLGLPANWSFTGGRLRAQGSPFEGGIAADELGFDASFFTTIDQQIELSEWENPGNGSDPALAVISFGSQIITAVFSASILNGTATVTVDGGWMLAGGGTQTIPFVWSFGDVMRTVVTLDSFSPGTSVGTFTFQFMVNNAVIATYAGVTCDMSRGGIDTAINGSMCKIQEAFNAGAQPFNGLFVDNYQLTMY